MSVNGKHKQNIMKNNEVSGCFILWFIIIIIIFSSSSSSSNTCSINEWVIFAVGLESDSWHELNFTPGSNGFSTMYCTKVKECVARRMHACAHTHPHSRWNSNKSARSRCSSARERFNQDSIRASSRRSQAAETLRQHWIRKNYTGDKPLPSRASEQRRRVEQAERQTGRKEERKEACNVPMMAKVRRRKK